MKNNIFFLKEEKEKEKEEKNPEIQKHPSYFHILKRKKKRSSFFFSVKTIPRIIKEEMGQEKIYMGIEKVHIYRKIVQYYTLKKMSI